MAPRSLPIAVEQYEEKPTPSSEQRFVKKFLFLYIYGNAAALYGLYLCCTSAKWETILMTFALYVISTIGVTAGAHRLWAHKAYKATLPLQITLLVMNSLAFQNSVFIWVKDHRQHHKYSDTDADPHNAKRGFIYSQMGWFLMTKTDLVQQKGLTIDMQDILSNPLLMFQKRYPKPYFLCLFLLTIATPVYCWAEVPSTAFHLVVLRFMLNLQLTSLVNSVAHLWGNKPYDTTIQPVQNPVVSLITMGEGFHNYHHTFPWDYKAAELGNNKLNISTKFIDLFAWIGWAYDLKSVPEDVVRSRANRTGDGTNLWGWGDKNMDAETRKGTVVLNKAL